MNSSIVSVHRLVWMALLAAMVAAGAYIKIPLGPIPFTMQTFFVVLAGFVLGSQGGALCLLLYLVAGTAGLPVFSGGGSGVGHLFGPTCGYLFGFVACAAISGLAKRGDRDFSWVEASIWGAVGTLVLFGMGMGWLMYHVGMSFSKAFAAGMLPFLPGGAVKLALAVSVRWFLVKHRLAPQ